MTLNGYLQIAFYLIVLIGLVVSVAAIAIASAATWAAILGIIDFFAAL